MQKEKLGLAVSAASGHKWPLTRTEIFCLEQTKAAQASLFSHTFKTGTEAIHTDTYSTFLA